MNAITKDSNFGNIYSQVTTDKTTFTSLKSTYATAVSDANTKLNAAGFDGWEDSISTKMQTCKTDFSTAISTINSDISSGNYSVLISKLEELATQLDKCKNLKSSIGTLESQLYRTTKYVEGSTTEKTEEYKNVESNLRGKKRDLDTAVEKCNSLITYINGITFNGELPSENPATTTETPAEEEAPAEEETPAEAANPFEMYGYSDDGQYPLYEATYTSVDEDGNEKEYQILINGTTGAMIYGNSQDGYVFMAPAGNFESGATDGYIKGSDKGSKSPGDYESLITDGHQNNDDGFFAWAPSSTYGNGWSLVPGEAARSGNAVPVTVDFGDGTSCTVYVPAGDYGNFMGGSPADFLSGLSGNNSSSSGDES